MRTVRGCLIVWSIILWSNEQRYYWILDHGVALLTIRLASFRLPQRENATQTWRVCTITDRDLDSGDCIDSSPARRSRAQSLRLAWLWSATQPFATPSRRPRIGRSRLTGTAGSTIATLMKIQKGITSGGQCRFTNACWANVLLDSTRARWVQSSATNQHFFWATHIISHAPWLFSHLSHFMTAKFEYAQACCRGRGFQVRF